MFASFTTHVAPPSDECQTSEPTSQQSDRLVHHIPVTSVDDVPSGNVDVAQVDPPSVVRKMVGGALREKLGPAPPKSAVQQSLVPGRQ
jgi:hypothetical protein